MHSSTPSSSPGGLLEPPSGVSYADFVKQWQDAHIARWLADNRCAHHAQAFRDNDIRGDIILELDVDNLRELGVTSVGDRTRIRSAIKELRRLCASNGPQGQSGPKLVLNGGSTDLRYSKTTGLKLRNDAAGIVQEPNSGNPTTSARNSRGRPAPLQLDNVVERDLPQIQRLDSARSATTPTPRAQASNNRAPSGPPPRGPLPSTPSNLRSVPRLTVPGSATQRARTPTESSNPPPFTNDPLPPAPSPASPWSTGAPGLPRNPAPGNLPGGSFAPRTTSPLPQNGRNRLQGTNAALPPTHQRQHSGARGGSAHPYSSANASLAPGPMSAHALSPVSESFIPMAGSPPSGYSVGRGPFDRRQPQKEDEVKRKLLKFWMGDMNSRVLDIRDLEDGTELLERALRKFGVVYEDYPPPVDGTLSVGGYAIYLGHDQDPLTETKLLALIHDPDNIGRENLHIRTYSASAKRSKLERILGEAPPQQPSEDMLNASRIQKKMNRASTVSVLSGLGVPVGSPPTSPGGTKSTSATSASFGKLRNFFGHRPPSELITTHLPEYFPFADKKVLKKTARNSMMKRQSMKPSGTPGSAGMWVPPRNTSRFSTSTIASRRSTRNSGVPSGSVTLVDTSSPRQSQEEKRQGMMTIPRVSIEGDDGGAMHLTLVDEESSPQNDAEFSTQQVTTTKALPIPPVTFANDTFSADPNQLAVTDTSRAARRASKITELKPSNPVPESAMVTVENVTTGIEQSIAQERVRDSLLPGALGTKRLSTASVSAAVQKRESLQPKEVPVDEAGTDEEDEEEEEEDEETEEEEEDEDEDEEEEEEVEDDTPEKVTSKATTRSIKWIRGALIGSGSFGNVYLGMDAQRGLLMAVKQVELKGSQYSEERKRSMLSALEREIELLKTLQHENIVQYLDSAIDDNNLNIFLEYVPGGSVASLLRNYGAFEESLTANWVRQILRGLEYLHGQTIIHRDIKGANILVDNKGGIKISDFGISKKVEEGFPRAHRMSLQGSVFWMAPEVVKQTAYTSKADIWSVGCLIIEMLTGQHPFPEFTQMQTIFKLGSGTVKPAIPSDISAHGTEFLQKTFELDHTLRPSATELLNHPWLAETV